MNLWNKASELFISKVLRIGRNATVKVETAAGTWSSLAPSEMAVLDGVTAGTAKASAAAVLGANKNLDVLVVADGGLYLGAGAGTAVAATAAEINAVADVSARVVNTTATSLALSAATHEGKFVVVKSTSPIAVTLPAATGSGNRFEVVVAAVATATPHTIKAATTNDIMAGVSLIAQTDTTQVNGFLTTATDNTISLNGTTKGGLVGDRIFILDIAAGVYSVKIFGGATGTVVTPFSHV